MRYYSASLGSFINRDPIEEAGGQNLYGYTANDPINRVDVLGLFTNPMNGPTEADKRGGSGTQLPPPDESGWLFDSSRDAETGWYDGGGTRGIPYDPTAAPRADYLRRAQSFDAAKTREELVTGRPDPVPVLANAGKIEGETPASVRVIANVLLKIPIFANVDPSILHEAVSVVKELIGMLPGPVAAITSLVLSTVDILFSGKSAGEIAIEMGKAIAISAGTAIGVGAAIKLARHAPRILATARAGVERITKAVRSGAGGHPRPSTVTGWCFVAGTVIATAQGAVSIENLQVGDRVLTTDQTAMATEIDPATWRTITLQMPNPQSPMETIDVRLLRSEEWLDSVGCEAGARIWLNLEEMGLHGWADVLSVEACSAVKDAPGRVILATVTHLSSFVLQIRLTDESEPLELTGYHRLFSANRNDWIPACEIVEGEELATRFGVRRVESIASKSGTHRVYNLEVETEHCYYAGSAQVLSHNSNPCAQQGSGSGGRRGNPRTRDHIDQERDKFLDANPGYRHVAGGRDRVTGSDLPEEYIPPVGGGRQGASYPDLTFEGTSGDRIRMNTVDTRKGGVLTPREERNADRIFEQTGEPVIAIPKP